MRTKSPPDDDDHSVGAGDYYQVTHVEIAQNRSCTYRGPEHSQGPPYDHDDFVRRIHQHWEVFEVNCACAILPEIPPRRIQMSGFYSALAADDGRARW